jgi:hypothetical protein
VMSYMISFVVGVAPNGRQLHTNVSLTSVPVIRT